MSGLILPNKGLVVPTGTAKPAFKFSDQREHAKEIFERLGNLKDIPIFFGQVLVAKYIRTTIGTGILEAAPQTQTEDLWQGKVGLVLKKGPLAFKDRPNADFGGADVCIGDWVIYSASVGKDWGIRTLDGLDIVHCKLLYDAEIDGRTESPDRLW